MSLRHYDSEAQTRNREYIYERTKHIVGSLMTREIIGTAALVYCVAIHQIVPDES